MVWKMNRCGRLWAVLFSLAFLVVFVGCQENVRNETDDDYAARQTGPSPEVTTETVRVEMVRRFDPLTLQGIGVFVSDNEGLARRAAINLAVADLASQVQTVVRAESAIYNVKEVRDVVENRVRALVSNYRVDSEGYDPGTNVYRARIRLSGEDLRREIERWIEIR